MTLAGKQVLFVSYNGMLDPLGQTQVIPYLRELSKLGTQFTLLSYEREQAYDSLGRRRCAALKDELAGDGIDWYWLRYHSRPSLPATSYDVFAGGEYASRLVRQKKIEMVHARSYVPAMLALKLKRRFGVKMIFDVRGLMADEYVDANHWRRNSLLYRISKRAERRLFGAADAIVTLTERIWPIISEWDGLRGRSVVHEVVPCCADLDRFKFSAADRARRRRELGIEDRFVLVYSGSIDGWYLTEAMADFFAAFRQQRADAHFLWLTPSRHDRIKSLMTARGFGAGDYSVLAAAPADVSSYLSGSDAGLAFIKPCLSKLASSPTKYAEYLGCGLPLIINAGIGDSDALITEDCLGALVNDFDDQAYAGAARTVTAIAAEPEQIRLRTREVAERLFDVRRTGIERYARLYEKVLA